MATQHTMQNNIAYHSMLCYHSSATTFGYHCLYHLLPPERHVGYDLRDRWHSHELIAHKYKMTRSSFIVRTLFDNM